MDFEESDRDIIKILHKYLLEALRKTMGDLRTVGVSARTRATQPPVLPPGLYRSARHHIPQYLTFILTTAITLDVTRTSYNSDFACSNEHFFRIRSAFA